MKNKNGRRWRIKLAREKAAAAAAPDILERVDTIDAVKTCILSKQMLKLPAMLSQMSIDIDSMPTSSLGAAIRANRAVAHVTDNVLSSRSPDITIGMLRIRFILKLHDSQSIAKSVGHALATHKVRAAEFEIITEKTFKNSCPADLVHYGRQFNTFLGACPETFAGLTRLWLRNMRFGELDIPNILSVCKCLEALHLTNCDSGVNSVLQVRHAQLVELQIDHGYFERVELTCLPKLQRIWVLPERRELLMPVLSRLRYASLDNLPEGCDIAWTIFILQAATSLKELCITVRDHLCIMMTDKEYRRANGFCEKKDVEWKSVAYDFKHRSLVKLTIYGFQPDANFLRYIRRVAGAAVNLAEISLHDRKACGDECGDLDPKIEVCPSRYPRTLEERKKTTEELGLASPAMVHFRCNRKTEMHDV